MDASATGHRLVLVDAYEQCHLVRIATPVVVALGWELHGPRAAMGLHFLVIGHSGQRLDSHFEALRVNLQAMQAVLHPTPLRALSAQWPAQVQALVPAWSRAA